MKALKGLKNSIVCQEDIVEFFNMNDNYMAVMCLGDADSVKTLVFPP